MADNIVILFGFLPVHYKCLSKRNEECAKLLVNAGHVINIKEMRDTCISAVVLPQMSLRKEPYSVLIDLGDGRTVKSANCTCTAGEGGGCKHVSAVIRFINTNHGDSCTSLARQWGVPKKAALEKYSDAKRLSDLYPTKVQAPPPAVSRLAEVTTSILAMPCPMARVLLEENKAVHERMVHSLLKNIIAQVVEDCEKVWTDFVIDRIFQTRPSSIGDAPTFEDECSEFIYAADVEFVNIKSICLSTLDQADCEEWRQQRRARLPSTAVHKVCRCRRNIEDLPRKLKRTISHPNLTYGTINENIARRECEQVLKKRAVCLGLVIHPNKRWLCGSPDGILVPDDRSGPCQLLEIKCPIRCKNKPIRIGDSLAVDYIYLDSSNTITLKESHEYFTQIQIVLEVTGLKECVLYLYSPLGSEVAIVRKDENFVVEAVEKAQKFYFKYFFPSYLKGLENQ